MSKCTMCAGLLLLTSTEGNTAVSVTIGDSDDIQSRLADQEIPPDSICVLPNNISTDDEKYYYSSTLPTVAKLLKEKGIPLHVVGSDGEPALLDQRSIEWFAPILFVGSMFYTQNPHAVSLALSVIASYLTDIFKGNLGSVANLTICLRDDGTQKTKKVTYKGPISGLRELSEAIETTMKEYGHGKS